MDSGNENSGDQLPATSPRGLAISIGVGVLLLTLLYLVKLNASFKAVPDEARDISPHRWTPEEMRETYERVKKKPFDWRPYLPPKLNRRYVVVGGSGLVGGDLVHLLLLQGHSPDAIRILDFRAPFRHDMTWEPASKVDYVRTDITSPDSLAAGFGKAWPNSVSRLPLTVFHTAALIRAAERHPLFYSLVAGVNVGGTRNVLDAAKAAGASILIATSSGSVAVRPPSFWSGGLPWVKYGKHYMQVYGEEDFSSPLRPHDQFWANYAVSKAVAERLVCAANSPGFRTGCIRPANAVYGEIHDQLVGPCLRRQTFPTWVPNNVQSFVASKNVGLGHMFLEAALARKEMPACAGRPFNISDPNPPPVFGDFYRTGAELAETPFKVTRPPPVLLFLAANLIEAYCIALAKYPILGKLGLKEPAGEAHDLQPAVFSVCTHLVGVDAEAKKPVEEGGLGYRGGCTTLEGFCEEILQWNRLHGKSGSRRNGDSSSKGPQRIVETVEAARATVGGEEA